jgi:hypothetical protein
MLQALPLAQESDDGILIDQAKQQGMKTSNKATKQQLGGGGVGGP